MINNKLINTTSINIYNTAQGHVKRNYNLKGCKGNKICEKMIKMASDAYYNSEDAIISDNQFDIIKEFLEKKQPTNKASFVIKIKLRILVLILIYKIKKKNKIATISKSCLLI